MVFDLDGVLLSERPYWRAAGATVAGMMGALGQRQEPDGAVMVDQVPAAVVDAMKERAVNSNWELTELLLCAAFDQCLARQCDVAAVAAVAPVQLNLTTWSAWRSAWRAGGWSAARLVADVEGFCASAEPARGAALMAAWRAEVARRLPAQVAALLTSPAARAFQQDRFQAALAEGGGPRDPITSAEAIDRLLARLADAGAALGVATGRPRAEALDALDRLGWRHRFAPSRIATHDEVAAAEAISGRPGLGKPHPFVLLRAAHPELTVNALLDQGFAARERPWLTYVGDAAGDLAAARAAGAEPIMVLTGCADPAGRGRRAELFRQAGAPRVAPDVLSAFA